MRIVISIRRGKKKAVEFEMRQQSDWRDPVQVSNIGVATADAIERFLRAALDPVSSAGMTRKPEEKV